MNILIIMKLFVNKLYNWYMNKGAKEYIKSLLALRGMTVKQLAELISKKTGKPCLPTSLSNKFSRGTMQFGEVQMIAELLGFEITFKEIKY